MCNSKKLIVVCLAVTIAAVTSTNCRRRADTRQAEIRQAVPAGSPMPSWYRNVNPEPDTQSLYFAGYSENMVRFDQALRVAERNAKAAAARYMGEEIIEKVDSLMEQSTVYGADGSANSTSKETVKEQLKAVVNQTIRDTAIEQQYVEKVTRGGMVRYDAGVLIAYPRKEYDRIKSLEALDAADREQVSAIVDRAQRFWAAGERDDAIAELQRAHSKFPLDAEISLRLGQYYEDMGKTDEAIAMYSRAAQSGGEGKAVQAAQARVTSLTNAANAAWLDVLEKHGVSGADLVTVLSWTKDGQIGRARKMSREQFETTADMTQLFAWYMTSAIDFQKSNAMAARYDYDKSVDLVNERVQKMDSASDAEPAIATLLGFTQQGLGEDVALAQLKKIKRQMPDAQFSPEIGDSASQILGGRTDKDSQALAEWLSQRP